MLHTHLHIYCTHTQTLYGTGIGNSSSDITTEISKVAAETFCVSRSGAWIQLNGFGERWHRLVLACLLACLPACLSACLSGSLARGRSLSGPLNAERSAVCPYLTETSLHDPGDAELLESGQEVWGDGKPFVMSRMEILRQGWAGEPGVSRVIRLSPDNFSPPKAVLCAASSEEMHSGLQNHQEWVNAAPGSFSLSLALSLSLSLPLSLSLSLTLFRSTLRQMMACSR